MVLKRPQWKVTKADITTTNYLEAAMVLRDMQDPIDHYLDQKGSVTAGQILPNPWSVNRPFDLKYNLVKLNPHQTCQ